MLDKGLDHEVTLVIYGRAAIALGFENPPDAVKHTLDVDGIIPSGAGSYLRIMQFDLLLDPRCSRFPIAVTPQKLGRRKRRLNTCYPFVK